MREAPGARAIDDRDLNFRSTTLSLPLGAVHGRCRIALVGPPAHSLAMGMERISFGWYQRRVSLPALLGYAAGALTYLAMAAISK